MITPSSSILSPLALLYVVNVYFSLINERFVGREIWNHWNGRAYHILMSMSWRLYCEMLILGSHVMITCFRGNAKHFILGLSIAFKLVDHGISLCSQSQMFSVPCTTVACVVVLTEINMPVKLCGVRNSPQHRHSLQRLLHTLIHRQQMRTTWLNKCISAHRLANTQSISHNSLDQQKVLLFLDLLSIHSSSTAPCAGATILRSSSSHLGIYASNTGII